MFNLAVDQEHVTLAFGLRWIETLSRRYEHIDVVTMTAGAYQLPANVRVWSVGREHGYSELRRALRFYGIVWHIMRERRIDVVFTHMIPIFAVLFWPVARLTGLRNVLWYAHGATPRTLRIAHRLVDRVVSPTPESFRLPSSKVTFIGHGVEGERFRAVARQPGPALRIITVGRTAPSKGLDVLIEALARWRHDGEWRLTVVGGGTSDSEAAYADDLRRLALGTPVAHRIVFTGRKSSEEVAAVLAGADVFVNLSETGSLDKAIVEAMASGCPVISSNDAFGSIARAGGFAQYVIARTPEAVRAALSELAEMSPAARQALADRQSEIAHRSHTLDGLMGRLCGVLDAEAKRGA
ncbi:MAG: glycosyltransferase [Rhizobiales bacterium]|nr:glycosyltransferase [Hyphomicrobiales bacterium]